MNLLDRLQSATPRFFKRIITLSLTLAAAATALLTAPQVISSFVLPPAINTAAQWCIVAGIVAAAVSKTTVDTTPKN